MKNLKNMSKDERSLLLYFESMSVEKGGKIDPQRMNRGDFEICGEWQNKEFINFGRIAHEDIIGNMSFWVVLSDEAWKLAHKERIARFNRIDSKRNWQKTIEKREDKP